MSRRRPGDLRAVRTQRRKSRPMSEFHWSRPCPDTGKQQFRSAKHAQVALENAQRSHDLAGNTKRRECRYYTCPFCGFLHLTSKPYEPRTEESAA